jgi:hypothetical protein
MKTFVNVMIFAFAICVAGCGGSTTNTAVTGNIDDKAIADYEANLKAQEEAENAAQASAGK